MTAGYSGKPLVDKLGIKSGMRIALVDVPPEFDLGPIPPGVTVGKGRGELDLVMFFVKQRARLEKRWGALTGSLTPAGAMWVVWPKKAAAKAFGIATDMTEDVVREVVLPTGWVDTKVCAVDDTWSGLKCVLRVELRQR